MPEVSDALQTELNPLVVPIYYGAFHPYQLAVGLFVLLGFIGQARGALALYLFGALFLLGPIWVATVVYVNRTHRTKIDSFTSEAAAIGRRIFGTAGAQTASYTIEHGYGNVRFVRPNQVIDPITVIVGDSSMLVYDDAKLELDRLHADFGSGTREFFFDSVASVNYDAPYFEIKLVDGDQAQYRSSRKPDDVLHELQRQVREYKRKPSRATEA